MIERAKIQSIIDNLRGFSRIENSFYEELDKSFDSQTLNIGVVGKMKAGKSSLVNAVIFGDEILPTSTAPSTVTLTEISYGEEENAIVEFMTMQDIEELKEKAQYDGDKKELIEKAKTAADVLKSFPEDYENYINKPATTIDLYELKKYVDSEGEYSGLAKSVKISLCNENLKGVRIIDTPGFNDPITSRGETTKKALQKCHVLLFVHNNDGYDSDDLALLTEQIEYAGISEIVDILNKVDLIEDNINKWPKALSFFVKNRNEMKLENENAKQLLKNSHSTYVSSLMALCGLIPYDKLSDDMKYQYGYFEEDFEELCDYTDKSEQQKSFVKFSNVCSVIAEINRLAKEGSKYLVNGPLMTLRGKLTSLEKVIDSEIEEQNTRIKSLNVTIESSKKTLDGFQDFIQSVLKRVQQSMLETDLAKLLNSKINEVLSLRATDVSHEFTEEKYPDPSFGSSGVTKANIANFNTFSTGFESSVRDILENMRDLCLAACKKEIKSLVSDLSQNSNINKEYMDELETSMMKHFTIIINDITIIVPSHQISEMPAGNQKQWDKLRTKFLNYYDDQSLHDFDKGLFAPFKQGIDSLDYNPIARRKLEELNLNITNSMNKTPTEKETEKKTIMANINVLQKEKGVIVNYIAMIDEIKNNINQ